MHLNNYFHIIKFQLDSSYIKTNYFATICESNKWFLIIILGWFFLYGHLINFLYLYFRINELEILFYPNFLQWT